MCELAITRREIQLVELARRHPAQLRVLEARRLAHDLGRHEVDDEFRAGVRDREDRREYRGDVDRELFAQFPLGRVEQRLARLELSAGKLPQTAVALMRGAPAGEIPAASRDHRGHDVDS